MGSWIKGPYGLTESAQVSATITDKDIIMDQNTNTRALFIDSDATTARVLEIQSDQTSGECLYVIDLANKAVGGTNSVCRLRNNHASSSVETLRLEHAGTGPDIYMVPRASAGIAAGKEGDMYFNATTHKLMIRGAAGWETVNSA